MTKGFTFRRKLILFSILLVFWIILTATFAAYDVVLGAICSALVAAVTFILLGQALDSRLTPIVILKLPLFMLVLLWEIVKANIDVAIIILRPKLPIEPCIIEYHTYLRGDLPRTVLADAITLTPGTVVVEMEDDELSIHCLAPRHAEGLSRREQLVAWLFGVKQDG